MRPRETPRRPYLVIYRSNEEAPTVASRDREHFFTHTFLDGRSDAEIRRTFDSKLDGIILSVTPLHYYDVTCRCYLSSDRETIEKTYYKTISATEKSAVEYCLERFSKDFELSLQAELSATARRTT